MDNEDAKQYADEARRRADEGPTEGGYSFSSYIRYIKHLREDVRRLADALEDRCED